MPNRIELRWTAGVPIVRFYDYGERERVLAEFHLAAEAAIPRTGEIVTLLETRYTVVKVEHLYTTERAEIEIYLELRA